MTLLNLKYIGVFFMLIDHIGLIFPSTPDWFRLLGRISAPIFFFALCEGIYHTKNKQNYMKRLLYFSIAMSSNNLIIRTLLNYFNYENYKPSILMPNIFLTLLLGMTTIKTIEKIKEQQLSLKKLNLIVLFMVEFSLFAFVEYNYIALASILIFYYCHDKKLLRNVLYIIFSLLLSLFLLQPLQMAMVLAIIFINEYTGIYSRKPNSNRNIFYFVYLFNIPILLTISLVVNFLGF